MVMREVIVERLKDGRSLYIWSDEKLLCSEDGFVYRTDGNKTSLVIDELNYKPMHLDQCYYIITGREHFPKPRCTYENTFQLGTDPEFFVQKNGTYTPAFKCSSFHYGAYSENSIYPDGFAMEMSVKPRLCMAYVVDNIRDGLQAMYAKGLVPTAETVLKWDVDKYDPRDTALGCDRSFNAYGLQGYLDPECPYRSTGFHIHIGCRGFYKDPSALAKVMDRFVGIPMTVLLAGLENPLRRRMYGLPGEYRLPKHGFEYRTLSGAVGFHPVAAHAAFTLARIACGAMYPCYWGTLPDIPDSDVFRVLMGLDIPLAQKITKDIIAPLVKNAIRLETPTKRQLTDLLVSGESLVTYYGVDLVRNWKLGRSFEDPDPWIYHCGGEDESLCTMKKKVMSVGGR